MAHVDVVTVDPDAWEFPPFTFGRKDGYYFGRGTQDNKTGIRQFHEGTAFWYRMFKKLSQ